MEDCHAERSREKRSDSRRTRSIPTLSRPPGRWPILSASIRGFYHELHEVVERVRRDAGIDNRSRQEAVRAPKRIRN